MLRRIAWAVGVSALALGLIIATTQLGSPPVTQAADHGDPPARASNASADIGDFYMWHRGTGASATIVAAITVAGNAMPRADQAGAYDEDVLYGMHFFNGDGGSTDVWIRFGQNSAGDWGMQVTNLPGETEAVEGAVETALTGGGGGSAWAGLADDPFFFDLAGFQGLVSSGEASSFSSLGGSPPGAVDTIAGRNATVIVIEFPASEVVGADGSVHGWASTGGLS